MTAVDVCIYGRCESYGERMRICLRCEACGCVCEWCDYCQRNVNPWTHFGPDHDYGVMQHHDRTMAASYGTAALPLPGCPPGCWYCTRLAELTREATS